MGNGDGTFQAPVTYTLGNNPTAVASADLNGDSRLDLVTASAGTGTVSVLLNNGDGTFGAKTDYAAGPSVTSLLVRDFNGDGHADIVAADHVGAGTVSVLLGNGDGTYQPEKSYSSGSSPNSLAEGDFNDDGIPDIEFQNDYPGWISVMLGNGDGSFRAPEIINNFASAQSTTEGDFNGDGQQDVAERTSTGVEVQLGRGDGTFYPEVTYALSTAPNGPETEGDFNGDGHPDLAGPTNTGTVSVVLNAADDVTNLAGAVGFTLSVPATTSEGVAIPATVTAVDASGNPVPAFRGTVYLTTTDPSATSPSFSYTFTPADNGIHTFTSALTLWTTGTQTVTASAPYMAAATGTVAVNPGPATHLAVGAPVAPATAGTPITVTVTAADTYNFTATSYTGTVHFSSVGRAGRTARRLHVHGGRRGRPHLHGHAEDERHPDRYLRDGDRHRHRTATITGDRGAVTCHRGRGQHARRGWWVDAIRRLGNGQRHRQGCLRQPRHGRRRDVQHQPPPTHWPPCTFTSGTLSNGVANFAVTMMTVGTQSITVSDYRQSVDRRHRDGHRRLGRRSRPRSWSRDSPPPRPRGRPSRSRSPS